MAGNPEYQNLGSYAPPDPVTPADSPSAPGLFAQVAPDGQGPAPYDIQAPMEDLAGLVESAGALSGAGVVYPQGPRQAQTQHLLDSPQGFAAGGGVSGWDITAGWSGEPGESWPNNPQPPA